MFFFIHNGFVAIVINSTEWFSAVLEGGQEGEGLALVVLEVEEDPGEAPEEGSEAESLEGVVDIEAEGESQYSTVPD